MSTVFDASALIALLRDEPGAEAVQNLLDGSPESNYVHAVNLCEVYYQTIRSYDERTARRTIARLYDDGVRERRDMSRRLWHRVGQVKARGRISIADCFCIALAQALSGEAVASDHHEFDRLVPLGLCPIRFIR